MPVGQPVWAWPSNGAPAEVCRRAGCNAGRFVNRMPLRLEEAAVATAGQAPAAGTEIQDVWAPEAIIQAIARVLERRGLA